MLASGAGFWGTVMQRYSSALLAAAAVVLAASQFASAADLGRRAPPPAPAYVQPAPPPYLWTGCYVGGNVGGAGRISKSPTLLPVERCQRAIVALLVAVRSAVITKLTRGYLVFAICLTAQV